MCGIAGGISNKKINCDLMLDAIKHRGPDGHGVKNFISESNFNICLGHRRLSIIDVTENSNQPFTSLDSNCTIVFNGEIYNYIELKNKYLSHLSLKSSGDTEVILELFCKYGTESFEWLEGMFAFSIYDQANSIMYICRDGIGIKPLYYLLSEGEFYFASEIAALKTHNHLDFSICPNAITEFFLNGFVYEPNTGFKNIKKVFPGCFIEISIGQTLSLREKTFWKPTISIDNNKTKNELVALVKSEYKNHLVSDVPIGLFFSGGIDSSVLLSLGSNEILPYFINSKSKSSHSLDLKYAKKIAKTLNRDIKEINLISDFKKADNLVTTIEQVAIKSEELISDYTFYVSEIISKKASEAGYKVMLSGMGADETFLGYSRYHLVAYKGFYFIIYILFDKLISYSKLFNKKLSRFRAFFEKKDFILKYTNLIGYFQESELKELLVQYESSSLEIYQNKLNNILKEYKGLCEVKQSQILDLYGFLSHNFTVADKSSMQAGIEIRVPLATPKLFQNTINTDNKYLMNFNNSKIPLISILSEKLNINLFKRPKEGFNPDLNYLLKTIGLEKISELLECEILLLYIKKEFIVNLLQEHKLGKKDNSYRIYQLLYFKFWLKHNKL